MSEPEIESEYDTDYEVGQDNVRMLGLDIHNPVFFLSAGLVIVFALASLVFPDASGAALQAARSWTLETFDWLFAATPPLILIFCIGLAVSPLGRIRLGGPDARPEFRIHSWVAMLFAAGVGIGFRPLRNLDQPFDQEFLAPAYLDVGGAVFLPGGDLRHGAGLTLSAPIIDDPSGGVSTQAFTQWAFTPSYHLLLPLNRYLEDMQHDIIQLQGRVGVPLVVTSKLGDSGVDFSVGLELGVAVHIKIFAGLGLYAEVQAGLYGGTNDTVHPLISVDGGLFMDYEVLP